MNFLYVESCYKLKKTFPLANLTITVEKISFTNYIYNIIIYLYKKYKCVYNVLHH